MDLKQLHALGAFVSARPIKRTIEVNRPLTKPESDWADPHIPEYTGEVEASSIDVYIKRLSSADEIAVASALPDDRTFVLVHRLVTDEAGVPVFDSVEQTKTLASWLLVPLVEKIDEVASRAPKKPSAPATHSGSNLRSPSGAARRKSGRKP